MSLAPIDEDPAGESPDGGSGSSRKRTWEIVNNQSAGVQQRYRLSCFQGDLRGFALAGYGGVEYPADV